MFANFFNEFGINFWIEKKWVEESFMKFDGHEIWEYFFPSINTRKGCIILFHLKYHSIVLNNQKKKGTFIYEWSFIEKEKTVIPINK